MSDCLVRKKELLKKREHLLVEIGLEILKSKTLPEEYESLPRDLQRTDRMIAEGERYQSTIAHELEQKRSESSTLENKRKDLLKKERETLNPLIQAYDELKAKQEISHSELEEQSQLKQAIGEKKNKFLLLKQELDERLEKIDRELRRIQNDMDDTTNSLDHLNETRSGRLRDLAYDYYSKNKKSSHFATKFGHYKLIELELQELCAQSKPIKSLDQIPNEKKSLKWLWVSAAALLVFAVFFVLKNEFSVKHVSFTRLVENQPLLKKEMRFLFDWNHAPESLKVKAREILPQVEGISLLQLDSPSFSNIKKVLVSSFPNGDLHFLAIELSTPKHQLEHGFLRENWVRHKNNMAVEAFTKDNWVWYLLNPTQFLFFPKEISQFELEEPLQQELELFFHAPIEPFDGSYPLEEGFNQLHLELWPHSFEWSLHNLTGPVKDLDLRIQYLEKARKLNQIPAGYQLYFQDQDLFATGPASLSRDWKSPLDAVLRVSQALSVKNADKIKDDNFIPSQSNPGSQSIIKLNTADNTLKPMQTTPYGKDLSDLFYLAKDHQLWVLDRGKSEVVVFSDKDDQLSQTHTLTLPSNFLPLFMQKSPQGNHAVLFGGDKKTRFGLLDIQRLPPAGEAGETTPAPVILTELPKHIDDIYSSAWDKLTHTLFLSVSSKGKPRQSAHALITYSLDSGTPILKQLIDFPIGFNGKVELTSLVFDSPAQMLYALDQYQGMLMSFHIHQGVIDQKNSVYINSRMSVSLQSNPVLHSDPHLMTLSRNTRNMTLLDLTDYSGKVSGNKLISIDLESTPPVLAGSSTLVPYMYSIRNIPLSNKYLIRSDKPTALTLVEEVDGAFRKIKSTAFPTMRIKRMEVDTLGEYVYLLIEEKPKASP
ncbi:MAG: hypothetical protein CSA81_13020 [Acidobacteria bacterium]|nr:MAG: hypothetical protein CSA81_13020 [Acidobacteriota bacterium]PIE89140.1 MAG: hypothetical protein CR997_12760 [Acidobacteriota bacterium]